MEESKEAKDNSLSTQIQEHIESFTCRIHQTESIRRIIYNSSGYPNLVCLECIVNLSQKDKKRIVRIHDHLETVIEQYSSIDPASNRVFQDVSNDVFVFLDKETEILQKLKTHVEKEKKALDNYFDTIKREFIEKIRTKEK